MFYEGIIDYELETESDYDVEIDDWKNFTTCLIVVCDKITFFSTLKFTGDKFSSTTVG